LFVVAIDPDPVKEVRKVSYRRRSAAADHEEGEVWFTKEAVARLVAGAAARRHTSGRVKPDTREALQARIDEARERLTSA
jgi:hypothetical protein